MAAAGGVAGFGSRWRTVCGLRVHALESAGGAGPAVVLLPGLVTASRSMVPLARALTARGMRVWIVDPPGFGYSDKPRRSLPVGEQAAVIAEWLTAIGGRPAMVLGNSFGSQVAAAVAAGHPGAVARLVLLSPTVAPEARQRLSWLAVSTGPRFPGPRCAGGGALACLPGCTRSSATSRRCACSTSSNTASPACRARLARCAARCWSRSSGRCRASTFRFWWSGATRIACPRWPGLNGSPRCRRTGGWRGCPGSATMPSTGTPPRWPARSRRSWAFGQPRYLAVLSSWLNAAAS
ncbi:MAG: alpha/beta fold hydrolase [Streptosporangiaceae bacterium]|nr:alpha/beta fold hydrolase [Streptosporangiaceae bacterium]